MVESKFFTLLSACDEKEIAGFHKYLRQAHANKRDALLLFEYFRKVLDHPDAGVKLELAYGYRKIYRKDVGDNRKTVLNNLSDLHLLLKDYLLAEKTKTIVFETRTLWLSILLEKGLEEEFNRQALSLIGEREALPNRSLQDYLQCMYLQHLYYYHFKYTAGQDAGKMLWQNIHSLDMYGKVIRTRMACEALHLKKMYPAEFDSENLLAILKQPDIEMIPGNPVPFLYSELGKLLETSDTEQFNRLVDLLSEYADQISTKELGELLMYLSNFLSEKSRTSPTPNDYWSTHRLNKIAFQYGVLTQPGEIRIGNYLNIVAAACKAAEFDWALLFATSVDDYLPPGLGTDGVKLAKAIIHIEKREYKPTLRILEQIQSKDVNIQIRAKPLMLICYYELRDDKSDLFAFCTNIELYLKRHEKPLKKAVQSMLNFVRIVKMLLRQRAQKQLIINQVNSNGLLYFRQWLLDKADIYVKK